jgi:hypothetical protein
MSIHMHQFVKRATHQVRNQTSTPSSLDGLLCGLRLLLTVDEGHVGDVDLEEVVLARPTAQLSHGLDERHALDISDGASKLNDADIGLLSGVIDRYPRNPLNPVLDGICDVRDDLHRLAQIVAAALALDDMLVDLARGDVVLARQGDVEVALVVAEIEVDLAAVGEDEDLAVPASVSIPSAT